MKKPVSLVLVLALFGAGALAGCGEEPIPDFVSYARDIKPLMEARCVRCHGAGGTLNADPDIELNADGMQRVPGNGYFNRLEDVGTQFGLGHYAPSSDAALKAFLLSMPPAPAPKLTERETDMLLSWARRPLP